MPRKIENRFICNGMLLEKKRYSSGCFEQQHHRECPWTILFNLKDSPFNNLWYRAKMMHFTPYLEMHNSLKVLVEENWGYLCINFCNEWIFQYFSIVFKWKSAHSLKHIKILANSQIRNKNHSLGEGSHIYILTWGLWLRWTLQTGGEHSCYRRSPLVMDLSDHILHNRANTIYK